MKPKFVAGKKINLRSLEEDDVNGPYANWLNDPEVCRYNSHARFPVSRTDLLRYVKSSKVNSSLLVFAICTKRTGRHIGNISLQNINYIDRSAEIAIIIGEKQYWHKGVGGEAWDLVLKYGFEILNLHRVYCGLVASNAPMLKLARKFGMKLEGRRRQAFFKNGHYDDILEFGILEQEYAH